MHIELSFALTADDIKEYGETFSQIRASMSRKGRTSKARTSFGRFGWAMIITLGLILLFIGGDRRGKSTASSVWQNEWPLFAGILAVLGWLAWIYVIRGGKGGALRALKRDPSLAEMVNVAIADESLTHRSSTATASMTWNHFIHFAETPALFVLMVSSSSGIIIPKRAFPSSEQMQEFRSFAQAHVGYRPGGFPVIPSAGVIGVPELPKMER